LTFRRITALAAIAVGTALLGVPASAHAETALPIGTPRLAGLGITSPVQDMLVIGSKVWVSTGNEVDVFSTTGAKLTTISGLLGAADLIASADRSQVFVALSQDSRIVTIDAGTLAQTASWPASPCPTHLGLAAGRLFYSYGCDAGAGAIGSLSLAESTTGTTAGTPAGTAGPEAATSFSNPPQLRSGGTTLVAAPVGLFPTPLTGYTANPDGTLTTLGAISTAAGYDFAVSPDGTQVIVTGYDSGYTINRYNTSDFSVAGTFAMGAYPSAVAYSADGSKFAGGLDSGSGDMLRVFDPVAGTLTSHSAVSPGTGPANPGVLDGTLQFSADGTLLYSITQPSGAVARLVTATALSVTKSKFTVTVTSATKYGAAVKVKVAAAGRPKTKVSVTVVGTTRTVSKVSDAQGNVVIPLAAAFNGSLTVTVAGDLRHSATTSSARAFRVPARLSVAVSGSYSASGGVLHFRKSAGVHAAYHALPERPLTYRLALQRQVGKKWTTVSTATFGSGSDGTAVGGVTGLAKKVHYREIVSFPGDAFNSKAPSVTSKVFMLG
jgi:hypothetical protein